MGLLDHVTVIDFSSVGPASRASAWLADFGARIIKVAPVPRDAAVQTAPPEHAYGGGRGCRRIRVDVKSDAGREVVLRLCEATDVVIESFRPGVATRLGIGYAAVSARNPAVVYCSTSGYGQTGSRAGWAGHDLNYLAVGGYLAAGEPGPDGRPPLPGATIADAAGGGMHAAISILAALVARGATGQGGYLDVAVTDGVLSLMSLQIDTLLATGREPPPGSAPLQQRFACYDTYRAGDGRWLAVAAIEPAFWANLCRAVGLPEEAVAEQYVTERQPALRAALAEALSHRSRDEWVARLAGADTCVTPVLSLAEVAAELRATPGRVARAARADGSGFDQLAPLLAGTTRRPAYPVPDPQGGDTSAVLAEQGFTAEEIRRLAADGVIA